MGKKYKLEESLICAENLSVGYNGKMILKDINFIQKNVVREGYESTGQVTAILGRSGRGKSTLFKALTGLNKPSTGRILINDLKIDGKENAKILTEGDVGFVDQKYTLFRHKTVYQICEYAMRKVNIDKTEKDKKITELLSSWGLLEHKDKYSCDLSGGQRQRTSIIEKILSDKHYLIFDEPASGLDVGNVDKLKEYFKLYGQAHECNTIIFSTHDINLAVELSDSIYIIGFPEGETEVSTIVKHYDLKEMGLAWEEFGSKHIELTKEIKEILLKS